jgi:hypothetical protein
MDVQRIHSHPLVPANIPIYGDIFDVRSGRLIEQHHPSFRLREEVRSGTIMPEVGVTFG